MLFNDCRKASIYSLEHAFLFNAAVSNIGEDSVTLTIRGVSADTLTSEVYVTFYDGIRGLVTHFCELTEYREYVRSPGVLVSRVHCRVGKQISVQQRRNDVKISVDIPVELTFKDTTIEATLCNLSAGGVFLTCRYPLHLQDVVSFPFSPDPKTKPFILNARILRIQAGELLEEVIGQSKGQEDLIGYGCQFVHLPPRYEAQIRQYVLRKDLNRRRRIS